MRLCSNYIIILFYLLFIQVKGARRGRNKTWATMLPMYRRQWPMTSPYPQFPALRQRQTIKDELAAFSAPGGLGGTKQGGQAGDAARRFTTKRTTKFRRKRSTVSHISLNEHCDYLAMNCLRGYQYDYKYKYSECTKSQTRYNYLVCNSRTGRVCGRGGYWRYFTFKNYCMLDFVNCRARHQTWTVVHMGDCLWLKPNTEIFKEESEDSKFMEGYYVLERD